jgi:hypothetical protein
MVWMNTTDSSVNDVKVTPVTVVSAADGTSPAVAMSDAAVVDLGTAK